MENKSNIAEIVDQWHREAAHMNKKILVLVEDGNDRDFWKTLIDHFVPELQKKIRFPLPLTSPTGKGEILKYKNFVSDKLIICRDSDNEYLYNEDDTFDNPFIFKTYYYSKESHDCYPENLNELIFRSTSVEYDITEILETYSRYTFMLLLYWLYFKRENRHFEELSWKEWNSRDCQIKNALSLKNDLNSVNSIAELDIALLDMRDRVETLLEAIGEKIKAESWFETFKDDIELYKTRLSQTHGLDETMTLFYLSGHIAYEYVVKPLYDKVVELLRRESEAMMNSELENAPERIKIDRLAAYRNLERAQLSGNFEKCLKNPALYPIMERIGTDLKNVLTKK